MASQGPALLDSHCGSDARCTERSLTEADALDADEAVNCAIVILQLNRGEQVDVPLKRQAR